MESGLFLDRVLGKRAVRGVDAHSNAMKARHGGAFVVWERAEFGVGAVKVWQMHGVWLAQE